MVEAPLHSVAPAYRQRHRHRDLLAFHAPDSHLITTACPRLEQLNWLEFNFINLFPLYIERV